MIYKEFSFNFIDAEGFQKDLFMHRLSEIGFDTFQETEAGFSGYIPLDLFNDGKFKSLIEEFSNISITYLSMDIPPQNWNEVWESNFEPLKIDDRCYVRATFHEAQPGFEYQLVIDPKMAFGTGHHQTTAQLMQMMLNADFNDQKVLDMGCGTGILGIFSKMLGASEVLAIDYDPVCYESALENAQLNGFPEMRVLCGSKEIIPKEKFDIILANINRNILLDQIESYREVLNQGGWLYISGFYESPDLPILREKAEMLGFKYDSHQNEQNWTAAKFYLP